MFVDATEPTDHAGNAPQAHAPGGTPCGEHRSPRKSAERVQGGRKRADPGRPPQRSKLPRSPVLLYSSQVAQPGNTYKRSRREERLGNRCRSPLPQYLLDILGQSDTNTNFWLLPVLPISQKFGGFYDCFDS